MPDQPGQAVGRDLLAQQDVVGLLGIDLAQRLGRGDRLGQGVDPLEPLAPGDHDLADAPQVVEGERAVLAPAVVVDPRPIAHREVAVADLAALAQDGPHLVDRLGVVRPDLGQCAVARARAA